MRIFIWGKIYLMCTSKPAQPNQNELTLTYLKVQFLSRKIYSLVIVYCPFHIHSSYVLYVIHTFISYYSFLFCTFLVNFYSSRENNLHKPYKGVICWSLHIVLQKYGREKIKRERKKIVLPLEIENTEEVLNVGTDFTKIYIKTNVHNWASC